MPELEEALPKYLQIADHIRSRIASGELAPGDEVPSERRIVADFGVSRPTATRALSALRSEGLVEARQGSGTYVREQPQLNRRARDRYARSRSSGRIYAPGERAEIRAADLVEAPTEVAEALELNDGAEAIRRKRVILADGDPVEVSWSWFDGGLAEVAPRLLETSRIREGTLAYVERATSRRGERARDRVGARLATDEERQDLELDEGAAVLIIHHTSYDEQTRPIEFAQAVYPPNRFTLEQSYQIPG